MLRNVHMKNPVVITMLPLVAIAVAVALGIGAQYAHLVAIGGGMLAVAGGALYVFYVERYVRKPIETLAAAIGAIRRERDLTRRLLPQGGAEAERLIGEFNALVDMLQPAMGQSAAKSAQLAAAAAELALSLRGALADCREQGIAAAAAATAGRDLTAAVGFAAESAHATNDISIDACRLSAQSEVTARETSSEMARIADTVSESARRIESLGLRSNEIDGIVKVIKDIAEQTNMLALNAAIEAARAGEQGRGFAVVADEVRKLAERTATATTEISRMIAAVQSEIACAIAALGLGNAHVSQGLKLAENVAGSLAAINAGAQSTLARANETAAAINAHDAASGQLAAAIERIARIAAARGDQLAKSGAEAERLEQAALQLNAAVGGYTA